MWSFYEKNITLPTMSHLSSLSPLTLLVVGTPQMTLQHYLSTLPCLPLPSANLQTQCLSIPWCYLPICSSVSLSFLFLSLSPAELSLPYHRILRCGHTIWVSVSLPWLGYHHVLHYVATSSFVTRSLYEMFRNLLQHLILRFWILLSSSAVKVQLSQA